MYSFMKDQAMTAEKVAVNSPSRKVPVLLIVLPRVSSAFNKGGMIS
jgi:hypothetical protein